MTEHQTNEPRGDRGGQEMSQAEKAELVRSTRRFDLRRLIGGLFVLYGVILTVMGISPSAADLARTGGININLWTGLGMLAVGVLFFLWDRLAPVPAEDIIGNVENAEALREEGLGLASADVQEGSSAARL